MLSRYLLLVSCLVFVGSVAAVYIAMISMPTFFLTGTTTRTVVSTCTTVPETPVPADLVGMLNITSTPPGAEVFFDTDVTPSGTTPSVFTLSPITHPLMLKRPGYKDYVTSVTIPAGSLVSFSVHLEPA